VGGRSPSVRALILAAGLGTRLRPLTRVRAKAAVPVNGEPLIRRVIRWLASQGIDDLIVNLHHRPESIGAVVGDGSDLGVRVRYSWEPRVLGSAGGPRRALPLLADGAPSGVPFLVVNGDTLTDIDIDALLAAHRTSGALVTMALIPNPDPETYGGVIVDNGRVRGFSRPGAARDTYHYVGVQAVQPEVFAGLTDGEPAESVGWLYRNLIRANAAAVGAHVSQASFRDIGSPAVYLRTSLELASVEGDRLVQADGLDPSAEIRRTAVWNDVRVGADARLEDCIVCDRVDIPAGARYRRMAIAPYTGGDLDETERLDGALVTRSF
jgi:NDP-sugar pyrophosphorylase family protein